METIELRPGFTIPRLLKGNWQIAEDHSDREFDDNELMESSGDTILNSVITYCNGMVRPSLKLGFDEP